MVLEFRQSPDDCRLFAGKEASTSKHESTNLLATCCCCAVVAGLPARNTGRRCTPFSISSSSQRPRLPLFLFLFQLCIQRHTCRSGLTAEEQPARRHVSRGRGAESCHPPPHLLPGAFFGTASLELGVLFLHATLSKDLHEEGEQAACENDRRRRRKRAHGCQRHCCAVA